MEGLGAWRVRYLEVYAGARPVRLGPAKALGVLASHGPMVSPMNKFENLDGLGFQNAQYFGVYSGARPEGLGPATTLQVGANQGPRVHPKNKPEKTEGRRR